MNWFLAYAALGMFSGFCAGMFGVGGGAVMVPILTSMFAAQAFPHEHVLHLALGSSMATIVFTSMSSLWAHHRRGAVMWPLVIRIAPAIVIGTLLGSQCASRIPTKPLGIFFAVFMVCVAIQFFFGARASAQRELPGTLGISLAGLVIGAISALVAIGGGSLSIPFMTWCKVRIHHAIGTSAAIGLPIALSGTVGYLTTGWNVDGLPADSAGYLYLPAILGMAATSVFAAPLGAKTAHQLPAQIMGKLFAALLVLLSAKMLHTLLA